MRLSEDSSLAHGCENLVANVSVDAVGFYEKIGCKFDSDHPDNDPKNPRMTKTKSTNRSRQLGSPTGSIPFIFE